MKEKNREEVEVKYQWDLSALYQEEETFLKDCEIVKHKIEELKLMESHMMDSGEQLYQLLALQTDINRMLSKLSEYTMMMSDVDLGNAHYQELIGNVSNLQAKMNETSAFIEPKLMTYTFDDILKLIASYPSLEEYRIHLEQLYRMKEHIPSEEEQKIVSHFLKSLQALEHTSGILRNNDMRFGSIEGENGEMIEVTNRNYNKLMESKNREVRKCAFQKMFETYEQFESSLGNLLAGSIEANVSLARMEHFDSALEASMYPDNIDPLVFTNLIKVVNEHLDLLHRYYALRKKILGVSDLCLYDMSVHLFESEKKEYPYEVGQELVLKALSVLGSEYQNILKKAFAERWIDVYPNKGKRGGAYSCESYDGRPFILHNYTDNLDSVSTLAHELGHSVNFYYSKEKNPYQYAKYSIFTAEIASTVNELLLNYYMLDHAQDKNEKLTILEELIDLFIGTIYRQTQYEEFEQLIYDKVEHGETLTGKNLSDLYGTLNEKYYGNDVHMDSIMNVHWARVPHFYYQFYCYQYATGLSAAVMIVNNILSGRENAVQNYIEFLKTGSDFYPLEALKIAGVDLKDKGVIENALMTFEKLISDYEKLSNS